MYSIQSFSESTWGGFLWYGFYGLTVEQQRKIVLQTILSKAGNVIK